VHWIKNNMMPLFATVVDCPSTTGVKTSDAFTTLQINIDGLARALLLAINAD
jgi:hypothetical protein